MAARILAETAICGSYDSTIVAVIAISMVGAVVVVAISCSCGSNKHSCFGNSNSSVGARMLDVVGEQ